eukprot:4459939-Pyramimonas_sp.AAC.1
MGLVSFAKVHVRHANDQDIASRFSMRVLGEDMVDSMGDIVQSLLDAFGGFVRSLGESVYESHVQTTIQHWLGEVIVSDMKLAAVAETTLLGLDLASVLPRLLTHPSVDTVCNRSCFELVGDDTDAKAFRSVTHNAAMRMLRKFCSKAEVEQIEVSAFSLQDGSKCTLRTDVVFAVLSAICSTKDIACVACYLHRDLVEPHAQGMCISRNM